MTQEMVQNEKFITISKEEYHSMQETIETLENEEVMEQLRKSKESDSTPLKEVRQELGL